MLADAIRTRLRAAPFKPFALRLTSGDAYVVDHPELMSLSPGGRHMILWLDDNRYVDIDVLRIETIKQAASNGGGRARRRAE